MVAVPTDRTAHMKHDLRSEQQHGRDLIGNAFRQMEMSGIQRYDFVILSSISQIEIVRTDRIAFQSDTERFQLHFFLTS